MKQIEGQGSPNHTFSASRTCCRFPFQLVSVAFLESIMLVMYFSVLELRKIKDQRVPTGNSKLIFDT